MTIDNNTELLNINDLFADKNDYTFIVGAGISAEKPSELPLAGEIINCINSILFTDKNKSEILKMGVRFEQLVELYKGSVDNELRFIEYFDYNNTTRENTKHNIIHSFLANVIYKGFFVATTNFDSLIEQAIEIELKVQKENISTISSRENYIENNTLIDKEFKNYPLIKLHGSTLNYSSGKKTKETLITTINSFCIEAGNKTVGLADHKIPIFKKITENRTLVFMGYSGGDDFDISPTIFQTLDFKSIIWVCHNNDFDYDGDVLKLSKNNFPEKTTSHIKLLYDIYQKSLNDGKEKDIYILNINTRKFTEIIWKLLLGNKPMILEAQGSSVNKSSIEEIKTHKLSDLDKFNNECLLFLEYNIDLLYKSSKMGLELSELCDGNNIRYQIIFHKWIGFYFRHKHNNAESIRHFQSALKLFPKNKYPVIKSEIFNELGRTYEKADRFRKALVYYKKALNCLAHKKSIKLKNEKTNGYNNNIASIYSTQRKFNKALDLYNQILNSNPDIIGKAFINLNIATILFMKRDFENAFMKCKLAIQLAGDIGDYTLKALFLTRLSLFYDQQGDYRNALKIQEETQHIYILINSLHGMAISLLNQGASLSSLGNRKDAIEKYKKALNIFTTIKDTKKMAELNHYIAGNYYEQMDILNAHQFETKAYEIACKHNYIEKIEYKRYLDLLKNYQ